VRSIIKLYANLLVSLIVKKMKKHEFDVFFLEHSILDSSQIEALALSVLYTRTFLC